MGRRAAQRRLSARVSKLEETNQALKTRIEQLTSERDSYKELYKAVLHRLHGRRSEKIDQDQLRFEFDGLVDEALKAVADEAAQSNPNHGDQDEHKPTRSRPNHPGRRPLPDDLERHCKRHELSAKQRECPSCESTMVEIGEDVTEELEYEPARFYIVEHARVKYACRACEQGITRALAPDRPIERGRPGPGLLAHIAVSKYGHHLPLYRLEEIFESHGVALSRQTMCGWVGETARLMAPIVEELKRELLADPLLQSDDTVVPYQGEGKGRVSKGYLWVYTRPYAEAVFDFTTNHSREGPLKFLGDYEGHLQTDGHSSYNGVYATKRIFHIGCLAHVRRKFVEAREEAPEETKPVLAAIQSLYRIEREAKTGSIVGADLIALRNKESKPIVTALGNLFEARWDHYRPKSRMAKAIGYARGQWLSIERYLDVAEACIDNNSSEQAIKPIVIGRKNWMFAGSVAGGERAATLYSLIVSCKRLGIDPYKYLHDVIARVSNHPNKRIGELTPRAWAALNP